MKRSTGMRLLTLSSLMVLMGACAQPAVPAVTTTQDLLKGWVKGVDVSEARGAEAAGVTFKDLDGTAKPALQIVKDHSYSWVRVRLMIDPGSPDGNYGLLQDLPYVEAVMKDAHTRGLKVLLDLHYSHWWADPGNQWTPARWKSQDLATLTTSVYDYTKDVITQLRAQGTAPDLVQIGNEINGGILWEVGRIVNNDMSSFVKLTNAGATAVRDASAGAASPPIMIHIAKTGNAADTVAWYKAFTAAGGQMDVIGLSYYPMWHGDLAGLKDTVTALKVAYPQAPVMLAETAYYWDTNEVGTTGLPYAQTPAGQLQYLQLTGRSLRVHLPTGLPYAQTPAGQLQYLHDLSTAVKSVGGNGIFYWGAFWSQSSRWLTAPGWKDDDASRRSLFDDNARATIGIDGLN